MAALIEIKRDGEQSFTLALRRFEKVQDNSPFFDDLADWIAGEERKLFRTQGASSGTKWPPLSFRYAAWKARRHPGKKILELSGALKESLTERPFGVEHIGRDEMTIGTDVPYAKYHQRGTAIMPARPPLIPTDTSRMKAEVRVRLQRWLVSNRSD